MDDWNMNLLSAELPSWPCGISWVCHLDHPDSLSSSSQVAPPKGTIASTQVAPSSVPVVRISQIRTKSMLCCRKIWALNSVRFCNISMRMGDHAPFLETHSRKFRETWLVWLSMPPCIETTVNWHVCSASILWALKLEYCTRLCFRVVLL